MVGFPSGQREQTVNLPSQTSKVRILPPPPSLQSTPNRNTTSKTQGYCTLGKDEKLRQVRVERSETTRFSAARRASRHATSYPSPTTILAKHAQPSHNTQACYTPCLGKDTEAPTAPSFAIAHRFSFSSLTKLELQCTIRYTTGFFDAVRKSACVIIFAFFAAPAKA